jgi:hypothetical protein
MPAEDAGGHQAEEHNKEKARLIVRSLIRQRTVSG